MSFATWFTFFCAASLIAISPGPGAVLSMSHGLSYGVKKASTTIIGLQAGLLLVLLIAGIGVGSLLLASETAFSVVKIVGALYLIYLGYLQWRTKPNAQIDLQTGIVQTDVTNIPGFMRRFMTGFLTNTTNPKGIIFMVAVLPGFIDSHLPVLPQLAIMALTMVAIDLLVMHSYAFLAASLQRIMRDVRAQQAQNRLFGAILMAIGAGLFFVKRSAHAAP